MVDDKVRIAHNKVIVIDGKTLIGGSYNFSATAEKHNAENVLIIKDDPVVQEYRQNWWNRFGKSRVLKMLLRHRL
jgi:phosphatidylserine/phosphatidylglycerophosphate/cardiolipin synthase-like enzyme